jgi:hypothetical protein
VLSCHKCGKKLTRKTARGIAGRGANGQDVALLNIGGRVIEVDAEIAPIVSALNAAGAATVASCSGHGHRPSNIALADGREIIIARGYAEARKIDALFDTDINGQTQSGTSRR